MGWLFEFIGARTADIFSWDLHSNKVSVLLHSAVFGPSKVLKTAELFLALKMQQFFFV